MMLHSKTKAEKKRKRKEDNGASAKIEELQKTRGSFIQDDES